MFKLENQLTAPPFVNRSPVIIAGNRGARGHRPSGINSSVKENSPTAPNFSFYDTKAYRLSFAVAHGQLQTTSIE